MLNHKDLQIGDWVGLRDPYYPEETLFYQVSEIREDGIRVAEFMDTYEDEYIVPIKIDKLHVVGLDAYINDNITISFKCNDFDFEQFHHTIKVSNCFDESVIIREWHLHLLQHVFKVLDIKYTINIKNNLDL